MTGPLTGRRILLVEDEMLVLMQLERTLKELGCTAICAAPSVTAALALLGEQTFDAAIIDINLGREKGYPVADALAEHGIPFAFSTGCSDHGSRADLDDRPVLRKPYVRAALVATLGQLLAGAQRRSKF